MEPLISARDEKYTGNVSFILNINEVDVTPSRENVIWNTKTREAVKNVYLSSENGNRPNRR
jgi:hypothetical protein